MRNSKGTKKPTKKSVWTQTIWILLLTASDASLPHLVAFFSPPVCSIPLMIINLCRWFFRAFFSFVLHFISSNNNAAQYMTTFEKYGLKIALCVVFCELAILWKFLQRLCFQQSFSIYNHYYLHEIIHLFHSRAEEWNNINANRQLAWLCSCFVLTFLRMYAFFCVVVTRKR